MAQSRIHFPLPTSLQKFTCFAALPFDIRYQIWEEIIYTPGIHFLKFVASDDSIEEDEAYSSDGDSEGVVDSVSPPLTKEEVAVKLSRFTGLLKPVFPLAAADMSYYPTMNKTLAQLSSTCNEAKQLVETFVSRPGNLKLDNGSLVLLERSSDIVCIDYPNMTSTRGLGKWADDLNLEQLAKIRRLAIRYSTEWDEESRVCSTCGRVHDVRRRHTRPRHVYEFAAMFKNLETFYFIDYLTVRKRRDEPECTCTKPESRDNSEHFACGKGGRTYHEVDRGSWKINTSVYSTLAWVQENYASHCRKYYKRRTDPEKVKFKVLACEWDTDKLGPIKHQEPRSGRPCTKRQRTHGCDLTNSFKKLKLGDLPISEPERVDTLPVVFGDCGKSKFEFAIKIPPR
ncbi:hypothetical protein F4779DRAFT_584787 [Xylariaceae sp. FL0662B]|nr:hypothetical protein F4779DRAFT_584787 [Xylariaceae sp. FL0662B]